MRFSLSLSLMLWLASFAVGCAESGTSCGKKALLLWPDAKGEYQFQSVPLSTSPHRLKSEAAEVYFDAAYSPSGYRGGVAEPRLTNSNGLCVPMDADSSLAVNAFAQFESLHRFEKRLGTVSQLSWPRKVGVQIRMQDQNGLSHNNAHYISDFDVIAVVPFSQPGLPLALNQGILAHEHFHAHFQSQVLLRLDRLRPVISWVENLFNPLFPMKPTPDQTGDDLWSVVGMNSFVLRGWNEGLADLFGSIYTGDPEIMGESIPQLAASRSLLGPVGPLFTGADVRNVLVRSLNPRKSLMDMSYQQGTQLARLLYRLASIHPEDAPAFLRRLMLRLPEIAPRIEPRYKSGVMDFEMILPILLGDQVDELDDEACGLIEQVVSKAMMQSEFARCLNKSY
ncbi:MAG: hypothetical protein HC902_12535 [Calothrix sp. SM1_5_4]|nr:hypothetical protein [Calothrix sp. SM1_5_4]